MRVLTDFVDQHDRVRELEAREGRFGQEEEEREGEEAPPQTESGGAVQAWEPPLPDWDMRVPDSARPRRTPRPLGSVRLGVQRRTGGLARTGRVTLGRWGLPALPAAPVGSEAGSGGSAVAPAGRQEVPPPVSPPVPPR